MSIFPIKYNSLGAAPEADQEVGEMIGIEAATEGELPDQDPDQAPAIAGETMAEVATAEDTLVQAQETDAAATAEATLVVEAAAVTTEEEADLLTRREVLPQKREELTLNPQATTSESDL